MAAAVIELYATASAAYRAGQRQEQKEQEEKPERNDNETKARGDQRGWLFGGNAQAGEGFFAIGN